MRASYRLAGQFALATLIAIVLGAVTAFIGAWLIGPPAQSAHPMIPAAYGPALVVFAISGLLMLMTVAVFIAAVIESMLGRGRRSTEQDASPNSRPPQQLPTSPPVQASDSLRTPPSGGCG